MDKEEAYQEVVKRILQFDEDIKLLFLQKQGQDFGYDYLYAIGVARRASSLIAGFLDMVRSKNSVCALALLRVHLDTMLRLYAGFWAKEGRHIFVKRVLEGTQINSMLSDENVKMTDNYLAKRLSTKEPWVINVYKKTSGYIHFSGDHIRDSLKRKSHNEFEFMIGPNDKDREVFDFLEPLNCFWHITGYIKVALEDWLGLLNRE